ncbi:MAG: hypothetical protein RMN51_05860 [Verrucomicrobiota bacterium]|nr:hypothetical protein [Limisphaera sp.]MDW8381617.1 hypothetical protein [Verrucomicrobiota bacterium]
MPIRINLLAEIQALEEERRRDPVKRALLLSAVLVACVLLGTLVFYSHILVQNSELAALQTQYHLLKRDYDQARANEKQLAEIHHKLIALHQLGANRFLMGNLLQALQKAALPDVPLSRVRVEQFYQLTEAAPAKTNAAGRVLQPARPATVTERILITLDARDESENPGDMVTVFKERIAASPWFRDLLGSQGEVVLRNLAPPVQDPRTGRSYVGFSLECRLQEKTR